MTARAQYLSFTNGSALTGTPADHPLTADRPLTPGQSGGYDASCDSRACATELELKQCQQVASRQ